MRTSLLVLAIAVLSSLAVAQPKAPAQPGALVLLIDRSGSMQGPKLEAAKNAAKAAVGALGANDQVAVVTFDSEATLLVKPQKASNRAQITKDIDRLVAGGGTNIYPGLKEAHDILKGIKAGTKHVILLSDGEAPTQGLSDLIKEMRKDNETISTVGVAGADENLLKMISTEGGGRTYKVDDLKTLSETFVKELKEAKLTTK